MNFDNSITIINIISIKISADGRDDIERIVMISTMKIEVMKIFTRYGQVQFDDLLIRV